MTRTRIIPSEHASVPQSWPKDWTEWHTNLKKLLDLVRDAVEDDHAKRRLERNSGSAKHVGLDS